ncbi:MAG: protein tyrosine phosphatase [Clostridia bacterium]|nr:protein tyrosine phosphatase [Clostridia bacterium]
MKILFVCSGNTCRSPMAEGIALKIISENKEKFGELTVASAGLQAFPGSKASENALRVTAAEGINLENFRSRPVDERLVNEADLILTMTHSHKQQLLNYFPQAKGKVFLLKEYISDLTEKEADLQKAEELYQRFKEKQERFLTENKEVLEKLQQKKEKLEQELEQVLTEIGEWQAKLYQETKQERLALEELEEKKRSLEISDPFGQPLETYRKCYQELYQAISSALEKIIKEQEKK